MTLQEYDLLVLRAFEALRHELNEAEEYTVQHYNTLQAQQKQKQEEAKEAAKDQTQSKPETKTTKKA